MGFEVHFCYSPDRNPSYIQCGLSLVTPIRLRKTWEAYMAGIINKATAIAAIYVDDDIEY
jgi:hypothetical protein